MSNTDNNFKVGYAVSTVIIYALVAVLAGRVTVNFQLALGIFYSYNLWAIFWVKILIQSENLYSVSVTTTTLPDWINVSLPSIDGGVQIRKNRVVTSISELSGIRGAHMMVALRVMSALTCILNIVAIQNDLHYRGTVFLSIKSSDDMVPIFLFIAAIGQFLSGHFELNNVDKTHTIGHYLGVLGISIGCFGVGFALHWNFLSISLITAYYGICAVWVAYCAKCPKKSDDIRVVTRTSKMCVGIELVMFTVYNLILVTMVYASGPNEGNPFASPFLSR